MPKFETKRGLLTVYSYLCGYIDAIDNKERPYTFASLSLDCIWHVKGMINGVRFWEVFERNELQKARKYYNKMKKEVLNHEVKLCK